MSAPRSRLDISVDEVVVRGLSPTQARAVVAALEARLQALGEDWAASRSSVPPRHEPFLRTPAVTPATASPLAIGESAATAVWTAVGGDDRR